MEPDEFPLPDDEGVEKVAKVSDWSRCFSEQGEVVGDSDFAEVVAEDSAAY